MSRDAVPLKLATSDEAWVQLATRIPKRLHRAVKVHCVKTGVPIMAFVETALREKLGLR